MKGFAVLTVVAVVFAVVAACAGTPPKERVVHSTCKLGSAEGVMLVVTTLQDFTVEKDKANVKLSRGEAELALEITNRGIKSGAIVVKQFSVVDDDGCEVAHVLWAPPGGNPDAKKAVSSKTKLKLGK